MVPLHALLVMQRTEVAEQLLAQLRRSGFAPVGQHVETEAEYRSHLDAGPDVILADPANPHLSVARALQVLRECNLQVPLLVITDALSPEAAIEYLRDGAADYVHMDRLERLGPAITRVLEQRRLWQEKEQARAARAESERALSTLIANLPGMAYRCRNDREWTMEFISQGCRELTGYPAAVLIESQEVSYAQLIHPEDRDAVWYGVQAAVETRRPFQLTYRIRTAQGEERWVWEQGRGVYSEDGQLLALEGFITDITDRIQAEEALGAANRQWQATFDAIGDAVGLIDNNNRILQCNRAMRELFGIQAEQTHTKCCFEADNGQHPPARACPLERMRRTLKRETEDIPWGDRWMRITVDPVFDGRGHLSGAVHIASDITERKRAGDSRRRLAAIVESTQDAIFSMTLEGIILSWNRGAEHVYGYQADEIVGKHLSVLVPRERQDEATANMARVCRGQQVASYDTVRVRKDGQSIRVSVTISPIADESGTVVAASVIARDITAQWLAEDRIHFQALLLDQVRNAVVAVDSDGMVTYWNRHAERLFQWQADEVVGRHVADLLIHESQRAVAVDVQRKAEAGGEWEGEIWMLRKDGSMVPVHMIVGAVLQADGTAAGSVGVMTDITERRRSEQALRESEARYRGLYEAVEAGILVQDRDGIIIEVNERAGEILGLSADQLCGRASIAPHSRAIREDGTPFPECDHPSAIALRTGATVHNVTMGVCLPDGEDRWLLINAAPIKEPDGRGVHGTVAIFLDITDRKRLEEEFRQIQKMDAVGRLAGGVAHDFNNLLMPIMTYSGFLVDRLPPGDTLHRYASQISKTAERAAALPRQLLAFSRKQVLQPKVLDLNSIIAEMESLFCRVLGENIELRCHPLPALGQVKADPAQIEQVLMNLVINARDAMPNGGKLTIETANADLSEEYVRFRPGFARGRYVVLAVSDTGHGMDKQTQARIFEPFFTTKEKGKGTGLGLATVYGIVKQSGGEVRVYSEPGKGSTFRIYLPRVDAAIEPDGKSASPEDAPRGNETILLVEDDKSVRDGVAELLAIYGYRALLAENGEEAIAISGAYADPIHLMITDVVMPGMSGRTLAERMATLRPEMKVVFISGYAESAVVHHGVLDEGIVFLQKPFAPSVLARTLRAVLDGR